jgi:hypothetical protein
MGGILSNTALLPSQSEAEMARMKRLLSTLKWNAEDNKYQSNEPKEDSKVLSTTMNLEAKQASA